MTNMKEKLFFRKLAVFLMLTLFLAAGTFMSTASVQAAAYVKQNETSVSITSKKTGWQKVTTSKGKFYGWFLFNKKGNHYANTLRNGYYFKADGRLASGVTVINGKSYFFKPSTSNTRNGQMVKNEMFVYKKKTYCSTPKS